MNPVAMGVALVAGFALFGWGLSRRLAALRFGRAPSATSDAAFAWDRTSTRLGRVLAQAVAQRRLRRELWPGLAHLAISGGFLVLLSRTLTLWGRGFDPAFQLWILGPEPLLGWLPLGIVYVWLKDLAILAVLAGAATYAYLRLVRRAARLTLNTEGLVILVLIAAMMVADAVYDGAVIAIAARLGHSGGGVLTDELLVRHLGAEPVTAEARWFPDPVGSTVATLLRPLPLGALRALGGVGFWAHTLFVLAFLVLLPHGKHFHVLTAVPNVFFSDLGPAGRLSPLASSYEQLGDLVDAAAQAPDPHVPALGVGRIEHLSPKARLDLFACTECGRCAARCPAAITGKPLSPKTLIVHLRDHLKDRVGLRPCTKDPVDLVPTVVHADVLWACTTCRACEEECPVGIGIVDKIVGMRRHLLTVRGDAFPGELARPLAALETNGNPYGRPATERLAWTAGLSVPTFAERPGAEVLFWVGCVAAFDPRARRIARATAALLSAARVDFAILGVEEACTGDLARRAGHEALFLTLAERNLATLARYAAAGGIRRVVTGCPHCLHTLRHEYPDLGGHYPVVHTSELLVELVAAGRLTPTEGIRERVVLHDACYLARYAGDITSGRILLGAVPGLDLVEVKASHGLRALCCGAGGTQAFLEEQNQDRISHRRARELRATGANVIASSCPFCMTMLTDGLSAVSEDAAPPMRDVSEILAAACGVNDARAG
ncbi:MAG: (Fe-S)-binding protein [Polyangiaceae bacterium]|nr:(Fe-S)-binding protein [Polyangiaceae bacterium]